MQLEPTEIKVNVEQQRLLLSWADLKMLPFQRFTHKATAFKSALMMDMIKAYFRGHF